MKRLLLLAITMSLFLGLKAQQVDTISLTNSSLFMKNGARTFFAQPINYVNFDPKIKLFTVGGTGYTPFSFYMNDISVMTINGIVQTTITLSSILDSLNARVIAANGVGAYGTGTSNSGSGGGAALGYTAENAANKATDLTVLDNSRYPTTLAVSNALAGATSGFVTTAGTQSLSGKTFDVLNATGNSSVGGNLTVTGTSTLTGTTAAQAVTATTLSVSGPLVATTVGTTGNAIFLSKVGVATITPAQALEVNGQVQIDNLTTGILADSLVTVHNGVLGKYARSTIVNKVNSDSTGQTGYTTHYQSDTSKAATNANVATNAANIATNVTNIATNTANIALDKLNADSTGQTGYVTHYQSDTARLSRVTITGTQIVTNKTLVNPVLTGLAVGIPSDSLVSISALGVIRKIVQPSLTSGSALDAVQAAETSLTHKWRANDASTATTLADSKGSVPMQFGSIVTVGTPGLISDGMTGVTVNTSSASALALNVPSGTIPTSGAYTVEAMVANFYVSANYPTTYLTAGTASNGWYSSAYTSGMGTSFGNVASGSGSSGTNGAQSTLATGQAVLMDIVSDGTNVTLYINGVKNQSVAGVLSDGSLYIGKNYSAGNWCGQARFQNIATFTSAFTQSQLNAHVTAANTQALASGDMSALALKVNTASPSFTGLGQGATTDSALSITTAGVIGKVAQGTGGVAAENYENNSITDGSVFNTTILDVAGSSFSIPTAGTWLVDFNVFGGGSTAAADISLGLYTSANVLVASSGSDIASPTGTLTNTFSIHNSVLVTTTGAATYKLRIQTGGGTFTIRNNFTSGGNSGGNSKITFHKVSGFLPVTGQTMESTYGKQTTTQGAPGYGTPLNFEAVDGTTAVTGNTTFTLTAGRVYYLQGAASIMSGTNARFGVQFYNVTTGAYIGAPAYFSSPSGSEAHTPISGMASAKISPTVSTQIQLRVTDNAGTLGILGGSNLINGGVGTGSADNPNSASWIKITQEGSSVYTNSNIYTGATASIAGLTGGVPAAPAGSQASMLTGDGNWTSTTPLVTLTGTQTISNKLYTTPVFQSVAVSSTSDSMLTMNMATGLVGRMAMPVTATYTAGSIPFANTSGLTQNNAKLFWNNTSARLGVGTSTPTSSIHLSQSSTSDGLTFSGIPASTASTSTATGAIIQLGYNTPSNKQLWFTDKDSVGSVNSYGIRFAFSNGFPYIDALSNDGSTEGFLNLGTGSSSKTVIAGAYGTNLAPVNNFTVNGSTSMGAYATTAAPTNGLIVSGNVGLGTSSPASSLSVVGSFSTSINTVSANYTATALDYAIYVTNGATAVTITLPSASAIGGRTYIVSRGTGSTGTITIASSTNVEALSGALGPNTSLAAIGQYSCKVFFQSDGNYWRRMN